MRVIALIDFNDVKAKAVRHEGDIFEIDEERYAEIMAKRTDAIEAFELTDDDPDGAPEGDTDGAPEGDTDGAPEGDTDGAPEGDTAESASNPATKKKTSRAKSSK